jgi:uncharacterized protein with HEPN domain
LPLTNIDTALREIATAIETVERLTASMDCDDFREDNKAIATVERNLEVISEAAIQLGGDAESRCPGPPWRDIRGMSNWLPKRHEWNWLSAVWKVVRIDLPPLKTAPFSVHWIHLRQAPHRARDAQYRLPPRTPIQNIGRLFSPSRTCSSHPVRANDEQ